MYKSIEINLIDAFQIPVITCFYKNLRSTNVDKFLDFMYAVNSIIFT